VIAMHSRIQGVLFALALVAFIGCQGGNKQPKFPDLNPVKGTVKKGGQAVNGGVVTFTPEPPSSEFLINSEVGSDGTYNLSTVRLTDSQGERKSGVPAGTYKVTYAPPLGDQTAGGQVNTNQLPKPVTVKAGDNNIPIDLPGK